MLSADRAQVAGGVLTGNQVVGEGRMIKRAIGRVLWEIGSRSFAARRALRHLGLRTHHGWYQGRVGSVEFYGRHRLLLSDFDRNYLSFQLFWLGWRFYEPLTTILLAELLDGRDAFIDVGANVGYYSLSAAAMNPTRVLGLEPNPKMNAIFSENVGRNGLAIEVEALAASDFVGTQRFYLPGSDMSGSLEAEFNESVENTIEVQTTTLDLLVEEKKIEGSLVIKIDAEGHEPSVLGGAENLLRDRHPDLILEVTETYPEETVARLRDCGYAFYPITETGLQEATTLSVCRRGDRLFLNTLATIRPPEEVAELSRHLTEEAAKIDLASSSLQRPEVTPA